MYVSNLGAAKLVWLALLEFAFSNPLFVFGPWHSLCLCGCSLYANRQSLGPFPWLGPQGYRTAMVLVGNRSLLPCRYLLHRNLPQPSPLIETYFTTYACLYLLKWTVSDDH